MRLWGLFFLAGMLSLNLFRSAGLAIVLVVISIIYLVFRRYRPIIILLTAFFVGFLWLLLHVYFAIQVRTGLSEIEGKTLTVSGYVVSIPEYHAASYTRFDFYILQRDYRVRLNWAGAPKNLSIGECLKLEIRLKKPHNNLNKNSFDYERLLFQQGIHAVGYVLPKADYQRLGIKKTRYFIHHIRQLLQDRIEKTLADRPLSGLISGLTVGIRSHIMPVQWQIMQATGTNHLMAISGLHIGFIAGFAFFIASWLWRRSGLLCLYLPAPQVAALAALLAAISYSALAGFSLPTQRAVIMTAAFLLTFFLRKHLSPWQGFTLALLIILIADPLSVLSNSFWLSFGAVGIILYGMSGRLSARGLWWKWGRVQWVVGLGLAPLTLLFFSQVSLIGLIANTIAIPWVGFIVLPLSLLGLMFNPCLHWAETTLSWLWSFLEWLSGLPYIQWQTSIPDLWVFNSVILGVLLLLAPRGLPGRWLGYIGLLPLLLWTPAQPKLGELWMTLLDVGQGLSVVIRTTNHTLVYDTGMRYGPDFDMGKAVIVPFLKAEGIRQIDRLIISHGDNDHIGGANSLLRALPVMGISTSVPERFSTYQTQFCQSGQRWVWDGVLFEFLYPAKKAIQLHSNDNSCVLRITHGKHRILLSGDIERAGERYLLMHFTPEELKADILVVPHHGSRTSSMQAFINAVNPRYALFAVGYLNRYRHPHSEVVERYRQLGSKLYFTSDSGAISFIIKNNLPIEPPGQYRLDEKRYWNN